MKVMNLFLNNAKKTYIFKPRFNWRKKKVIIHNASTASQCFHTVLQKWIKAFVKYQSNLFLSLLNCIQVICHTTITLPWRPLIYSHVIIPMWTLLPFLNTSLILPRWYTHCDLIYVTWAKFPVINGAFKMAEWLANWNAMHVKLDTMNWLCIEQKSTMHFCFSRPERTALSRQLKPVNEVERTH